MPHIATVTSTQPVGTMRCPSEFRAFFGFGRVEVVRFPDGRYLMQSADGVNSFQVPLTQRQARELLDRESRRLGIL